MRNPLDSPWHLADGVQATVPHRLPSGHVVQLWRAGPEPHLQSWYQPAAVLCHQLRSDGGAAPLDLDELLFLGRIDEPGGRSVFAYRHRVLDGELLLDAEGVPHGPVDDPRRRSGHRFEPIGTAEALGELRRPAPAPAPPAVTDRVDTGDGAVVLPFRRRPASPGTPDGLPPVAPGSEVRGGGRSDDGAEGGFVLR